MFGPWSWVYSGSSNMNYFIYTSHYFTPWRRYELSINWPRSQWMCAFIAQLVEYRTGSWVRIPLKPWFFQASFHLLKLKNLLRWSFFTLSLILYISIISELNKEFQAIWLVERFLIYRGYYTVAQRYEFYFRVAQQYFTNESSEWVKYCFLPREIKIHIFKPPWNVLFII